MDLVGQWNSLEVAKLAVAALTPLVVLALTLAVNRAARRVEQAQWANRQVIERRLELYDEMAPALNDLYCGFQCIGNFRDVVPPRAIELKRDLDKRFHTNKHLFSPHLARAYKRFMQTYFRMFAGVAKDAELRTSAVRQRLERGDAWNPEWARLFANEPEQSSDGDLIDAYDDLMSRFANELGVGRSAPGARQS